MRRYVSQLYDKLYEKADKILKELNPCQISCGKCKGTYRGDVGLCCRGCKYLSEKGCSVKALGCKVWLCGDFEWEHPATKALLKLRKEAISLGLPIHSCNDQWFRMSKDDFMTSFFQRGSNEN